MNDRKQKLLVLTAACLLIAMILGMIVKTLVFDKAARMDKEARDLRAKIDAFQKENRTRASLETQLHKVADRMIGGNDKQAGSYLTDVLLRLADDSRLGGLKAEPYTSRAYEPVYREVGQTISVSGKLDNIVDFLYLLSSQSFYNRLDGIKLTRSPSGEMSLTAHYAALIADADPAKLKKIAMTRPTTDAAPLENLDTDQRKLYGAIASRDMFRPYVKRISETPPAAPVEPRAEPRQARSEPMADFRLCGLAQWGDGQEDITLQNTANQEIRHFKLGDRVGGGEIVMIDFRVLPMPSKPQLNSTGRLILKIDKNFWAVDVEQRLSEKRLLKMEQLPIELMPKDAEQAASAPVAVAEEDSAAGSEQ